MTSSERARRLAAELPDSPVPCPVCSAAVKGANLERHLGKAHAGGERAAHESRWGGPERIGSRRLLALGLLVGGVGVGYVVAGGQDTPLIMGTIGFAAATAIIWSLVEWSVPLFPGRLRVDHRGALLRHSFGLGRRRLRSIDQVVLGSAWESRPSGNSGDDYSQSVDERIGTYLEMRRGRRGIRVHCRTGGAVRATWAGWDQGKRRKRLDITLDRTEFVALQLALWELGALTARRRG